MVSMSGRFTLPSLTAYSMSKHAAIAFSDGLRRETRMYGIKVSTIEPTAYKTQMNDRELINNALDEAWNESGKEVQELYGEDYFLDLKKRIELLIDITKPGNNIESVIDMMSDAVRNNHPQARYVAVSGGFSKLLLNKIFVEFLPTDVVDSFLTMLEKRFPVPIYLRNLKNIGE